MKSSVQSGWINNLTQSLSLGFNGYIHLLRRTWPVMLVFVLLYCIALFTRFMPGHIHVLMQVLLPTYAWFLLAATRPSIDQKNVAYFLRKADRIPISFLAWILFYTTPVVNLLMPIYVPVVLFALDAPKQWMYLHVFKKAFTLLTRTKYWLFYFLLSSLLALPLDALYFMLRQETSLPVYGALITSTLVVLLPLQLTFLTNYYINAVYDNFSLYYTLKKENPSA